MTTSNWIFKLSPRTTGHLTYQMVMDGIRSVALTHEIMPTKIGTVPLVIVPRSKSSIALRVALKGMRLKSSKLLRG